MWKMASTLRALGEVAESDPSTVTRLL